MVRTSLLCELAPRIEACGGSKDHKHEEEMGMEKNQLFPVKLGVI